MNPYQDEYFSNEASLLFVVLNLSHRGGQGSPDQNRQKTRNLGLKYIFENQATDFKVWTDLSPDLAVHGSLVFGQQDVTSFRTVPIINSNGRVIVFALIDGVSHLNVSNGTSFRIERK